MQNLISLWLGMDARRRVIVVVSTVAMFAAIMSVARMASAPTMSLLYAGVEGPASGDVIRALDQQGVIYEVRGSAIYVEAARRDQLRLTLAGEGLPANGGQGYEILDGLTGFGTTSQMFDAAYWRAKEGELARTIVASPAIASARVHLSASIAQPFRRTNTLSGSVAVAPASGPLGAGQANALRFLVASAVAGLEPENVSVIDTVVGAVVSVDAGEPGSAEVGDRAASLKANAERLLEARVGTGRALVEVSLDVTTQSEQITERIFDPDSRVAISTDTDERTTTSSGRDSGNVTVASNLPQGDAGGAESSNTASTSQTQERINYEVSETQREILKAPGAIKRMTIAVLVDGIRETDANGDDIWTPRSDSELASLRDLVASAVGYDEARGDTLTLQTMEFAPPPETGSLVKASALQSLAIDVMSLIQFAVLAFVSLVIGLFVLRPALAAVPATPAPPPLPGPEPGALQAPPALTGEIQEDGFEPPSLSVVPEVDETGSLPTLPGLSDDPAAKLRDMVAERQDESREILRRWMAGDGEPA